MRAIRRILRSSVIIKRGKRFKGDSEGATAIEFALVAMPFFGILFAIMETALAFFVEQVVDMGVSDAARLVRTGQAQNGGFNEQDFRNAVCGSIVGVFDCQNNLKIDVRTLDNFPENPGEPPVDEEGNLIDDFVYQPGAGGQIVLVRGFLEWPSFVPNLGSDMKKLGNGNRLLMTTVTFRNEPF